MTSKFIPPNPRAEMPRQQMPDLSTATDVVCENCGNLTFQEVILLKKISALVSPNGKEGLVPIPTFSCVACGYVNKAFRPLQSSTTNEESKPQVSHDLGGSVETEPTRPKLVLED